MERKLKEAVMAKFEVLSQYLPEGTEEEHEDSEQAWPVAEPRF